MATGTVHVPFVGPKANQLFLWRDPKRSGAALAAATLLYVLFGLSSVSAVWLLSRALAVGIAATWIWAKSASFFGRTGPPVPPVLVEGVSHDQVKPFIDASLQHVNTALKVAGAIISGTDNQLSLYSIIALMVGGWLLSTVSLSTLAFTTLVLLFTLPKGYELKKKEVDALLDQALSKAKEVYKKVEDVVLKKAPSAASAAAKKVQ